MILRGLAFLAGLLPERAVAIFAEVFGALWFHVFRYRRHIILENLARAFPDQDPAARKRLGKQACVHLVRALFDLFRIPRHQRSGLESVVRLEGFEHLDAARAKGKGVLILSGHLGSFELSVAAAGRRAAPVSLVVKRFPPFFNRFLAHLRTSAGLKLIYAEGALRPILRALALGEAVAFVLDQNATRKIGVFVDFFGEPACTMSALAVIAERSGAFVVAAIPYRDDDGAPALQVLPEIPWESMATREETLVHMTQVYTRVIEDAIRRHPAQWFWTHKRWRTRPK